MSLWAELLTSLYPGWRMNKCRYAHFGFGVLLQSTLIRPELWLKPVGKTAVELIDKDISFLSILKMDKAQNHPLHYQEFSLDWDWGRTFVVLSLYRSKGKNFKDVCWACLLSSHVSNKSVFWSFQKVLSLLCSLQTLKLVSQNRCVWYLFMLNELPIDTEGIWAEFRVVGWDRRFSAAHVLHL